MHKLFAITLLFSVWIAACSTPPTPSIATVPPEPTNTPIAVAQSTPTCTSAEQHAAIDTAFAQYQAARSAENNPIPELNSWLDGVSAEITLNCLPDTIETSTREQLTNILAKLQTGGYIIYVRHTHTDRSGEDTDITFGSCDTQRILSEQGREEALLIRRAYNQLKLPVSQLISTQYCRTLETTVLAFGVPQVIFRSTLSDEFDTWLSAEPDPGSNTIIVAHIGTIRSNIGLDATFEEGDALIYEPMGAGEFEFVGRIGLYDWPLLAEINRQP